MSQLWNIGGKMLNHGQIQELKRQKLDPLKDEFEMKDITSTGKSKKQKAAKVEPKHEVVITPEIAAEYPELADQGVAVGDKMEVVTETPEEAAEAETVMPFTELRELAKSKGMEVLNTTKKAEILAFLEANK